MILYPKRLLSLRMLPPLRTTLFPKKSSLGGELNSRRAFLGIILTLTNCCFVARYNSQKKPFNLESTDIIHDSPRILGTPGLKSPMPQQAVDQSSLEGDLIVIAPQLELRVYSRRRNLQATKFQPPKYCHEFEPMADPNRRKLNFLIYSFFRP